MLASRRRRAQLAGGLALVAALLLGIGASPVEPARGRRDPRRLPGDRGPDLDRRDLGAGRRVPRRERRARTSGRAARRMPSSRSASCTRRTAWRRCSGCCGWRAGGTAEIVGGEGLPADRLARILDLRGLAESKLAELDRGTRALLVAYARGVNARIERIRDGQAAAPVAAQRRELPLEDWRPEDSPGAAQALRLGPGRLARGEPRARRI